VRTVPKEVRFKTKPEIALEQLRWACAAGLPHGVVLMDAGYGEAGGSPSSAARARSWVAPSSASRASAHGFQGKAAGANTV
jgi:SRSO17 transposase